MHVCSQPDDIVGVLMFDKFQQTGDLQLAAEGLAIIVVGDSFPASIALGIDAVTGIGADRHIGGDDFPDCVGMFQLIFQPSTGIAKECGFGAYLSLQNGGIGGHDSCAYPAQTRLKVCRWRFSGKCARLLRRREDAAAHTHEMPWTRMRSATARP